MLRNYKTLITHIKNWLSLIIALYFSGFIAVVVLLLTTIVTLNRVVALSISLLSLIVVGWILLRGPVERMSETDSTRRVMSIIALSITVIALSLVMYRFLLSPAPPYTPIIATSETKYWDLATGSRIAYTYHPASIASGGNQLPPVILVHGGPGSPSTRQADIVEALNDIGFDVYDYHQVGAGLSSRLNDVSEYTVERHVEDLEAIRQSIGVGQIILIGGSWGGQLIANYLAAYPEYVSKAVVSSPSAIWSPAYNNETRLTDAGNQDLQDTIASYPRIIIAYLLMQNLGPRPAYALLPDKQMDGVFQHFVGNLDMSPGCSQAIAGNATRIGPAGLGFWVNAISTYNASQIPDPRPALQRAMAPVLVLRGECDYIAWEITREYRDILPNAILLPIDNAGHTIETHQPDVFREVIIDFLLDAPLPLQPYVEDAAPW